MDLHLMRCDAEATGIFSDLRDMTGNRQFVCLEHAFPSPTGFAPIIPPGTYTCLRGKHRLEGMEHDFETFEVIGINDHSGLLFHWGNYNRDSKGCILLGEHYYDNPATDEHIDMITNSRRAFDAFMKLHEGETTFQLAVS